MTLSRLAEQITTSPILQIAAAIKARQEKGEAIHNLTVGDFDSAIFPIPEALTEAIITAYRDHQTNYPGAVGLPPLRAGVAALLGRAGVACEAADVIVSSGCRPIIYALYQILIDRGDKVVYPVPSWNNESYAAMVGADAVTVETTPETNFMPTAAALAPHLKEATLLALCSPQNPTGTLFTREALSEICELVVAENKRRAGRGKPLYVLFDQIYWMLTYGDAQFHHPLTVCPAIRDYAIFADGVSKSFAATGVRVGWVTGPRPVVMKLSSLLAHMGAWAPKPEQIACGHFLADGAAVSAYLETFRERLGGRLTQFYEGFMALKAQGHAVHAIRPQAALYLSVKIDIQGKRTPDGTVLDSDSAVQDYLLNDAHVGVLPFSWFGAANYGNWYRLSVGTCRRAEIPAIMESLNTALERLS